MNRFRGVMAATCVVLGTVVSATCVALLFSAAWTEVDAFSGGLSGFSGNPATNGGATCNECHKGGLTPIIAILGPTVVQPGSTNSYMLTMSEGQKRAGGLDVSASDGTFSIIDPGTYLIDGEVTQLSPRNVNPGTFDTSWSFNWTAPLTPGTVTMFAAGNSVNLQQGPGGDAQANETIDITVMGAPSTPGESSGPALQQLLVSGYDPISGDMSLIYDNACESTDNNIHFGDLDQVAVHDWTGSDCGIGVSGSYAGFNPGNGSYFFVVVGNDNALEGSYGVSLDAVGGQQERPPYLLSSCGQSQDLSASCD